MWFGWAGLPPKKEEPKQGPCHKCKFWTGTASSFTAACTTDDTPWSRSDWDYTCSFFKPKEKSNEQD